MSLELQKISSNTSIPVSSVAKSPIEISRGVSDIKSSLFPSQSKDQKSTKSDGCCAAIKNLFRSFWDWLCGLCVKKGKVVTATPLEHFTRVGRNAIKTQIVEQLQSYNRPDLRLAAVIRIDGKFSACHFDEIHGNAVDFINQATNKLDKCLAEHSLGRESSLEIFTFVIESPKDELPKFSRKHSFEQYSRIDTSASGAMKGHSLTGAGLSINGKIQVRDAVSYLVAACQGAKQEISTQLVHFMLQDYRKKDSASV
jgi:hypothetical protein